MHCHPGGLVNGQKVRVLKQDIELFGGHSPRLLRHGLRFVSRTLRHPHRRQAQHVTHLQARFSTGAAFVDPHFAAANDAVNVRLGHPLEVANQVVVQALLAAVFLHRDPLHGSAWPWRIRQIVRRGIGPYNVFH